MQSPSVRRRTLGAATAGSLATGACLVAMAPTAQAAAPVVPDLKWNVSQQFVDHLSTRALSGGATHVPGDASITTDDYFTFPGAGSSSAGGVVTYDYTGTVRGGFVMASTEYYSVTIADPSVSVEPDGDGKITGTVSAANAAAQGNPAASTPPTEVTIAEFAGAVPGGAVTVTPKWAGVLPADSAEATALGIAAGKPVEGKSFHPSFLGALTSGVRAHFYASGASSDSKKAPGAVTVNGPTVTPTVTGSSYASGVTIRVEGAGFNPATNPGDAGVYVGLAPADAVIDYGNRGSMAQFAAVDWVMPSRFTGDAFTTVINAPTDKLDRTKTYAIYTWQAHTHSNTSQDTKTPVAIDFATLATPATPTPTPTPAPVEKADSTIVVKVRDAGTKKATLVAKVKGGTPVATGTLKVKIKVPSKKAKKRNVALENGKAVVTLPAVKRFKVVLSYGGDASYDSERRVVKRGAKKR